MRQITVGLAALSTLLTLSGPALAEPARPALHEEAARLLDQVTDQIRNLGAQVEQYLHHGHPGPHGEGGRGGMMGPQGPGAAPAERPLITLMLAHRADLGLTADQASRLESLRADFARDAIRRDAEIRIAELDLAALLEQESLDMTKVETKIREVAQLRADLRIARLRIIEQGKAVLTPEQRTRLRTLLGEAGSGARRTAGASTRL